MADALRRLILIPRDVPASQIPRLADALSEAIGAQNRLAAKSPYVLRFTGTLEQDSTAFWVTHEPATPLATGQLFDEKAPLAAEDELLRAAAAVLDALAAAHSSAGGRSVIHGGLCPGVVLTGADGLTKITDFGFAPAICKTLGVDSFLNLAVGSRPDASGRWEVLSAEVMDRDDRLCAFIDPDKYGQDTLASFEPGSDIVAAGILLHLLAEHRHPYLYFERQAHRVVDMARMMSFGVPAAIRRKDLCESGSPAARALCELLMAMLARLPGDRPGAADLIQRLVAAAPQVDVDVLKAQRWLAQIEKLLADKQWHELEAGLKDAPQLKAWPVDLRARVDGIERQFNEYVTAEGRRAAVEAELQTARAWFSRLQAAVTAGDWGAAPELLNAKPQIEHWPEEVAGELPALVARIEHERAVQKARAWGQALRKAFDVKDWAAVGRRFAQRPAPEHCPPDVAQYAATVATAYQAYLDEQERQRQEIERQHTEVRTWLEQAKSLTDKEEWVAAIDHLGAPPQVEHWPPTARDEAEQLTSLSRNHLSDAVASNLDAITENIRRQAETAVREVLATPLAGLLHADRVETAIDFVMWAPPDTDADGRARVLVRLRPPAGPTEEPSVESDLDFFLRGENARISRGLDTLRTQVHETLLAQVFGRQTAQLSALQVTLQTSIFPAATIRVQLTEAKPQVPAEIQLLGPKDAEGSVPVELRWSDTALTWTPANWSVLTARALELARTISEGVVRADILKRSLLLKTYDSLLGVSLAVPPGAPAGALPKSLAFEARIGVHTADRRDLRLLYTGTAACNRIGQSTCDADLANVEAKLGKLVLAAQDASRQTLHAALKQRVKAAAVRVGVSAPKREKALIDEAPFELKPKAGNPVTLTARWNVASLVYEFPTDWEQTLAPLLAPPPPPPPRAKVAKPPGKPLARRSLIWGVSGVVFVLAVGGAYLAVRGGGSPPPEVTAPPTEVPAPPAVTNPPPEQVTPPPARQVEPPPQEPVKPPSEEQTPPVHPPAQPPEETAPSPQPEPTPPEQSEPPPSPEEVQPPPARQDPVQSLRDFWLSRLDVTDSKELSVNKLFNELIPVASGDATGAVEKQLRFLTAVLERATVSELKQIDEKRVSVTASFAAIAGSGDVTQNFTMYTDGEGWKADSDNVHALAQLAEATRQALLQPLAAKRQQIEAALDKGNLKDAHAQYAAARPLLEPLATEKAVADLRELMSSVPPPWDETRPGLATVGYVADGESDPYTGYPPRLKDRQGNVLVCASLAPGDTLWADLKDVVKTGDPLYAVATAAGRSWRIFYIDGAATATDDLADARAIAKERARSLPTRDEWFLVALRLRTSADDMKDLIGGLWQWCDDPASPAVGRHWLCGGSRLLVDRQPPQLPVPRPSDDLSTWWAWLTNPLVMQRRPAAFGDQLTGVRTVLRIYPRE